MDRLRICKVISYDYDKDLNIFIKIIVERVAGKYLRSLFE
jgi:hypothetical protein